MNEILKFQTNIPELVTFKYNDFREGTGQYGAWYKYVVENRGIDKTIFAKEGLHQKLQSLVPLQGKQLEITLAEVDGRKRWKILLGGEEVAQTTSYTTPAQKPATANPSASDEVLKKMRAWATETNKKMKELEARIYDLEMRLAPKNKEELSRDIPGVVDAEEVLDQISY